MIIFIYGTTAEAIKIAPVARRLRQHGIAYQSWVTYQHTAALRELAPKLDLEPPTQIIADGNRGEPLRGPRDVLRWLASVTSWGFRNLRRLRKELEPGTMVVVHGDTLTTVIGVLVARRLRVPSLHIEAGLRSGHWRHPFPEELDRRIAGALATVHYAPSQEAVDHLKKRSNVVFTHGNTVIDAVTDQGQSAPTGQDAYGVALLHRFEFVSNRQLVEETFEAIAHTSPIPVRVITDAYSEHGLQSVLSRYDDSVLKVQAKLDYPEFVGLLRGASYVLTDSGGIQAEAALLGVPTLIHRKATEQYEGIGQNIVLSEWKVARLKEFLSNYEQYRRPAGAPEISPSDVIVADIRERLDDAS